MSRIAEAAARAGVAVPVDGVSAWENGVAAAEELLAPKSPTPNSHPTPKKTENAPVPTELPLRPPSPAETIDFELTAAMRRIFLSPKGTTPGNSMRSVLFCTVPGDRMSDVAWHAAEVVATQSGKRVAFVEDGTTEHVRAAGPGGLITRVGWYAAPQSSDPSAPVLGEHVPDLFGPFEFVIVSATAPAAEDLVPIAREVDGVIVVISENESRRDATEALVEALRAGGARLLGAVFANVKPASRDSLFSINS